MENQKNHIHLQCSKKTKVLTVPYGTIKSKIMAATNWTIIKRNKATNRIILFDLESKWTYKTAIGIATELNNNEINELVCIVETNKIMLKNDKEEEKKTDI